MFTACLYRTQTSACCRSRPLEFSIIKDSLNHKDKPRRRKIKHLQLLQEKNRNKKEKENPSLFDFLQAHSNLAWLKPSESIFKIKDIHVFHIPTNKNKWKIK